MPAKVFVSCGQRSEDERAAARAIAERLRAKGFDVFVAISAQSIEDVNSGIIGSLRDSDYYVFIDFPRDDLGNGLRGSLFTNQELAIAYILGFEQVVFFQQEGVTLEGLLRYMGSNATRFASPNDVPDLVIAAIEERHWSPSYSRHLTPTHLRWSDALITYGDLVGRFLYVDIENHRHDLAAYDTVARLRSINGVACADRSHLKVTGHPGFAQVIWPREHGAFDLLMVSALASSQIFMNSALDVWPKPPIITAPGKYDLEYAVLARRFPLLLFHVELSVKENFALAEAELLS